jgi:hypothetical protein
MTSPTAVPTDTTIGEAVMPLGNNSENRHAENRVTTTAQKMNLHTAFWWSPINFEREKAKEIPYGAQATTVR